MKLGLAIAGWIATVAAVTAASRPQRAEYRYGVPASTVQERHGYLMEYDGRTRQPRWVLEYMDRDILNMPRKAFTFKADPAIPKEQRVQPGDYIKSGYDRGHLAPVADNSGDGLMSAISPMQPDFNRHFLPKLESKIRDLVVDNHKHVWVVTVPMWLPLPGEKEATVQWCGSVPVPTHIGKCILWEDWGGTERVMRAWVLPNRRGNMEVDDFLVSVDQFERLAGLDVWSELEATEESDLEGAKP